MPIAQAIFHCALGGPFDALRRTGISAYPALCNCTSHLYPRVIGLRRPPMADGQRKFILPAILQAVNNFRKFIFWSSFVHA
jgi:hypothetical protein